MGSVYEAYDRQRQSRVAIKVMRRVSGGWIHRFKREFRSLAGIVHPNLVTLHELIQWQDQWLFTMELVHGLAFSYSPRSSSAEPAITPVETTPDEPVHLDSPPSIAMPSLSREVSPQLLSDTFQVSAALCQLCDGLDYLHHRGIVHGDVKPSNTLITLDGRVVILDFGISRDSRSEQGDGESLPVLGTPGYLAPERFEGQPANPPSDMFAVGVMLFEVLAGQRFDSESDAGKILRETRAGGPKAHRA